jgi:Xaa-Pro aminopeptidase
MTQLERLRERMAAADVPALLVSDIANVQWLTGFTGSFGQVLVTPAEAAFLTDSRYTIQAGEEVQSMPVFAFGSPKKGEEFLAEQVARLGITDLRFEPTVTYGTVEKWRGALNGVILEVAPDSLVPPLRMVKTEEEIAKIAEACKLADACLEHVVRLIQPGVAEYDIGLEIEFFFRRHKAGIGFPPIVASGPNSARPHARPGERRLEIGDFITLDLGATLDGYNSDITRTFVVGNATDRHREIYDQVLKAEMAAIEAMVVGANGKDVDELARRILDEKGLAQYFGHSLGHGLGRSVHDAGRLHFTTDQPLEAGQVWTIEPGVYIEGFGGVRIEDDVVVTDSGPRVLTSFPKELMVLP